jgi:hypothetical protein
VYWQGIPPARRGTYGRVVDNRREVREFLISRRAKITRELAGLPAGANRRVPGLRRSEVASLAGVSIEYYSKLERGASPGYQQVCTTPSPAPSNSTTPSGRTWSTSPAW